MVNTTEILKHIDHTLLSPTATWAQIQTLCEEALQYQMASVCVPPGYVRRIHDQYADRITICTVIGFPLGYTTTAEKAFSIRQAIADGAKELDAVINITDVKNSNYSVITNEIAALREACGPNLLKIIVETCYLTEDEKIAMCNCVTEGGADYIKTSTGFGSPGDGKPNGAILSDIALFRAHIGPHVKIKASGGIRTREQMEAFLSAGCDRIGTSGAKNLF